MKNRLGTQLKLDRFLVSGLLSCLTKNVSTRNIKTQDTFSLVSTLQKLQVSSHFDKRRKRIFKVLKNCFT